MNSLGWSVFTETSAEAGQNMSAEKSMPTFRGDSEFLYSDPTNSWTKELPPR